MKGGLARILPPEAIELSLRASDRDGVLRELAALLLEGCELDCTVEALRDRENQGSTGVGGGVAIPHVRLPFLTETRVAFGRSGGGISFGAVDGKPVDLFFLLLAPEGAAGEHLKSLARVSRLLRTPGVGRALREARTREELLKIIAAEDAGD